MTKAGIEAIEEVTYQGVNINATVCFSVPQALAVGQIREPALLGCLAERGKGTQRNVLLVANVGDPTIPNSFTLSMVDVAQQKMVASIPVPGRTRWAIFDPENDLFFVNIADPPQIVVADGKNPKRVDRMYPIPVAGPHGLDIDVGQRRLFCACDGRKLVVVDTRSGQVLGEHEISGSPDVIFFNDALQHLYVAIGDPGVIEVFNTGTLHLTEQVQTEKGAHTLAFDPMHNEVYAFLPQTHRAAVYTDMNE